MGEKIKKGDVVKIDYEGKLEDGKVFDSSKKEGQSNPIEFEVGAGKVIPGFDEAVEGMEKGETKEFTIPSEKAYGKRVEELKKEFPKSALQTDTEPEKGMVLMLQSPEGQQFPAQICDVGEETITLDLNHPLAGQDLSFNIEVVEVTSK